MAPSLTYYIFSKVYGGLELGHLSLLLEAGLKNDSVPETFTPRHKLHGQPLPSSFIKIVPLEPWATSYNYSIWHVGKSDQVLIR